MQKQPVVIIIPIYKSALNSFEEASVANTFKVLKEHQIVFIAPESLNLDELKNRYPTGEIVRFNDQYFENIDGYNKLMLCETFYNRFINYDYMLICQTDAYVLKDDLLSWCNKGYDYIGAPWIPSLKYFKLHRRIELTITQFLYRIFKLYGSRCNYFQTGNGGFSLRKIDIFHAITVSDKTSIKKFLDNKSYHYAEDIYWSIKVNHIKNRLKIPKYTESINFAFENRPDQLFELNNKQLPFGCHAFYKGERLSFWKKHIPELLNIQQ